MKRYIKSNIVIDLDYPDSGTLELKYTGEQHSISTTDGLIWRKVYQANDGTYWMKIDNIWREVKPHSTGFLFDKRRCDLRRSQQEKDEERKMYEKLANGGFNPMDGI